MKPHEIQEKLGLTRIRDRNWYVQPACATTGDGLFEGPGKVDARATGRLALPEGGGLPGSPPRYRCRLRTSHDDGLLVFLSGLRHALRTARDSAEKGVDRHGRCSDG
ncbi:hypothetical protein HPB52_024471 [Rhipicephalus sanguineus]|uniref:Uncharacterized protein n=1 Tax=Rhipicephalus sanguineus TaxID=34632 RepID=A0A9D4YR06_RHISA|nr:hypothetical protein HPB52_024471 [Rhipicephalus sanguineus]